MLGLALVHGTITANGKAVFDQLNEAQTPEERDAIASRFDLGGDP